MNCKHPPGPPMTLDNCARLACIISLAIALDGAWANSVGEIVRNKRIGVICLFNCGLIRSEDESFRLTPASLYLFDRHELNLLL